MENIDTISNEVVPQTKVCKVCKIEKSVSDFYSTQRKHKKTREYKTTCKQCCIIINTDPEIKKRKSEFDKQYRDKNKQAINLQRKAYREANKEFLKTKRAKFYSENKKRIRKYWKE